MAKTYFTKQYDPKLIEALNGVVADLPDKTFLLLEILHRKDWNKYTFALHNPDYGTVCEADWMDKKDLLPALHEMKAAFELMIQELEEITDDKNSL